MGGERERFFDDDAPLMVVKQSNCAGMCVMRVTAVMHRVRR